jgi:hypothetical protein
MQLIILEQHQASGGVPDAWQEFGVVDRSEVAAVRARLAASSKLFKEARSIRPNIDFSRDKSVRTASFVDAPMDDDFDW